MGTIVREQMGDQDKRGRINGQRQIRTNGIPPRQPSLGVLANYYSAAILEIFTRESAQNPHRTRTEPPDDTKRNKATPVTAGLLDGSLSITLDSPTTNTRRLQKAFEMVIRWAGQNGLNST